MNILDQLAEYSRLRVAEDKKKISLDEIKKAVDAYGFEKILDELKRKDEGSFRVHMTSYFGSSTSYYRYKLGQTGLVPEQQQYILQWCKGRGYTNMRFDRYTEEVNY